MTARLVFVYRRHGIGRYFERCACGASDCTRCRGPGADRECRCEDGCQCDPCDDHEEGEACPTDCPTRCRCRNGCECESDAEARADAAADDAYDRTKDEGC